MINLTSPSSWLIARSTIDSNFVEVHQRIDDFTVFRTRTPVINTAVETEDFTCNLYSVTFKRSGLYDIICCGGGGAGASGEGNDNYYWIGSGGNSGVTVRELIHCVKDSPYALAIGMGGTVTGFVSGSGGSTTFGGEIFAAGGSPGLSPAVEEDGFELIENLKVMPGPSADRPTYRHMQVQGLGERGYWDKYNSTNAFFFGGRGGASALSKSPAMPFYMDGFVSSSHNEVVETVMSSQDFGYGGSSGMCSTKGTLIGGNGGPGIIMIKRIY